MLPVAEMGMPSQTEMLRAPDSRAPLAKLQRRMAMTRPALLAQPIQAGSAVLRVAEMERPFQMEMAVQALEPVTQVRKTAANPPPGLQELSDLLE